MRNSKRILCLLLVFSLMLCIPAIFAGCNSGEGKDTSGSNNTEQPTSTTSANNDNAYTVTIVDNEGNPVSGVSLMITNTTDVFKDGTTDSNGKFSAEVTGTNLGVMIVNVPDGYEKPAATNGVLHAMFENGKSVSVTVNKKANTKVTYTVKVVDQNGDAVEGATLQLCPNGTCLADNFTTDANGACTKDLSPNLPVDVKIVTLPDGYTKPEALNNGYHAKIEAGEAEVTITVTKN